MENNNENKYVNVLDIGHSMLQYGLPYISFDNLVLLGQHTVRVYNLEEEGKRITFSALAEYICKFVDTPFGAKFLSSLH